MTDLLDTAGIAQILNVRREFVRDRLVKRPDFPRPAMALSQKNKRWSRESLEKWLAKQAKEQAR